MTTFKSSNKKDLNEKPATKICKYFFGLLIGLVSLSLLVLILLPTIASTQFGKEKIENYASQKIDRHVTIERVNFSFFGPQEIHGIKVTNNTGQVESSLGSATFETSLIHALATNILENPLVFTDLNIALPGSLESNSLGTLKNVNGVVMQETSHSLLIDINGVSLENNLEGEFHLNLVLNGVDARNLNLSDVNPNLFFALSTELRLELQAKNFPISLIDAFLSFQKENYKPHLLESTFGKNLEIAINAYKKDGETDFTFDVTANAPNLNANISTKINPTKMFITAPSTAMFALSQELLDYFDLQELGFHLEEPANVLVAVEEFSLPFNVATNKPTLTELLLKARVDLNEAKLTTQTTFPDITLQKFSAEIVTNETSEVFNLKITGDASQKHQPIKLSVETTLHKSLDFRKHKFPPLKINLKHIPVAMVDHLFGLNETLTKNIGTHADLKMEALVQKDHLDLNIEFESDKVSIPKMIFKIDDDLTMVKAPTLSLKLTDKFAKKVLPENAFLSLKVDEPLNITFHLNPVEKIYEIKDFLSTTFSGILTVHNIALNIKENNEFITFQDVVIPWKLNVKEEHALLSFTGKTKHSHEAEKGSFSGNAHVNGIGDTHNFDITLDNKNAHGHESKSSFVGSVEKLLTSDKALNLYGMGVSLDAKIADLPTPLFCKVACLDKSMHDKIEVLFGSFLNADMHVRLKALNGLIQANVMGKNGSFNIDSQVNEGFLFLNKPFQAKFHVTPRLGESILQDIFPFLSGVVSSDQPILIAIANEGFIFPLKRIDLSRIEIPQATISLGHVKFDNSGELANVLSLLTPQNSDLISVWFTPLYLSMHEGVFKLERVDMLISQQFPIATWGKVDFIADKVKMKIGLSGYALKHAFKVKELDNDYMVQIPLNGTTSAATIDKVNATTKIGALVAQGHGGPKGLVLGTVLSLAGGALTEEKPPKSMTIPLPWAEELKRHTEAKEIASESKNDERKAQDARQLHERQALENQNLEITQEDDKKHKRHKKSKKFKLDKELENQAEMLLDGLFKSIK
jgi:hypothetical protein